MMKTKDTTPEAKKDSIQRVQQEPSTGGAATITDNRPSTLIQRKRQAGMNTSAAKPTLQRKNKTGLPDKLKSGIENLSGYAMDDVKVHYNSSKPAQLRAHAYAQGSNIHLAAGQEKHLPHEAWHVVQQKQGRVKPTMQLKSKVNINDNVGLEKEADVMGAKAAKATNKFINNSRLHTIAQHKPVIQRYTVIDPNEYEKVKHSYLRRVVNREWGMPKAELYEDPNTKEHFLSQKKNESGSFINKKRQPNYSYEDTPRIRVSDNAKMAIQDVDLRENQAKFFYGDIREMFKWNRALLAVGAIIRLDADKTKRIKVPTKSGRKKELVKIQAENKSNDTEGLDFSLHGDCQVFATTIMGGLQNDISGYEPPFLEAIKKIGSLENEELNNNDLEKRYGEILRDKINDTEVNEYLSDNKLNEFAIPEVGRIIKTSGFQSLSEHPKKEWLFSHDTYNNREFEFANNYNDPKGKLYSDVNNKAKTTRIFGSHYGAVIAKDGGDYITLENYERKSEGGFAINDIDFYFQMYGSEKDQTWHEHWAAIDHGGPEILNPFSYVLEKVESNEFYDGVALNYLKREYNFTRYNFNKKIENDISDNEVRIILFKALAYANQFGYNELAVKSENYKTITKWETLIKSIDNRPRLEKLKKHVLERIGEKKYSSKNKRKLKQKKRQEAKLNPRRAKRNKRGISIDIDEIMEA